MSQIMGLPADDLLKPAGYNSPITECCADRCKVFLDGSYRRGQMDTVEKVLEIIKRHLPHGESWMEDRWSMGYHDATKSIQLEVQALVEKQQAVQMFEDMLDEQALKGGEEE